MDENIVKLYDASRKGNAQAQNDLGVLIAEGKKIPQNYEVAASLFNESANQGNSDGIANLAHCFAEGIGVNKNLEYALELLNKVRRLRREWTEYYVAVKKKYDKEKLNQNPFFLVKITDFAKEMLDGQIFMRPLSAFWNLEGSDESVNNSYRGDNMESISKSYTEENIPDESQNFFNDTGIKFKNAAQQDLLLSQNMIYCMYVLEFNKAENRFILPDKRIKDFGHTAVIIYDCEEFLKRVTAAKMLKCGYSSWMSFKRVEYNVNIEKNQSYDEFCKGNDYAWQNEFRISIDVSNGNLNKKNWECTTDFVKLTSKFLPGFDPNIPEQLSLNIDMKDISVSMPVSDFLQLKNFNTPPISHFIPPLHTEMLVIEREPMPTVYRPIIKP